MKHKHNWKRVCAGVLSVTLLSAAIIPHIGKRKVEAFHSHMGVCMDNHNYSSSGKYVSADNYSDKMVDLRQFTFGSEEYKANLAKNIDVLHQYIGTDESTILKAFWAGVTTFVHEGNTFQAGAADLDGAKYWYNYIAQAYHDSEQNNYVTTPITEMNMGLLMPMSEAEFGAIMHNGGEGIFARDPLLQLLTTPGGFFSQDVSARPQVAPRLSKAWLTSYDNYMQYSSGGGGRTFWPKDSIGHEISLKEGEIASPEVVAQAALDMETNSAYWYSESGGSPGSGSGDDSDEGPSGSGSSGNKNTSNKYWIKETDEFYFNGGTLCIWDGSMWQRLNIIGDMREINGWHISVVPPTKPLPSNTGYTYFEWRGEGKPTELIMFVEIPEGSIVQAGGKNYESTEEFVANFMRIYTCDSCGHGTKVDPSKHQRHIAFRPDTSTKSYPCFRIGGTDPVPGNPETDLHFCIFRHTEDWESNYNVQLDKFDYETGKPLENSVFELYERFDDKDEVNRGHDGAVELYEGIENDSDQEWQSKYTSSPVVWDDFRLVNSFTTDTNGHIETDVKKGYHYEKTFCDGHPAPTFAEVPEEGEGEEGGGGGGGEAGEGGDDAEAAKNANKEVAGQWLEYYEACEKMAEEDRPGVHFHWVLDGVDPEAIKAIAESGEPDGGGEEGGEGGEGGKGGSSECPGIDEAYEKSGCQQDCQDTYDKFINLKYSYTWKEVKARDGYIKHDFHTDDVPIEVITTNSSEAGAQSEFADEYSRDITINDNVDSGGSGDVGGGDEGDEGDEGGDEGEDEGEEAFLYLDAMTPESEKTPEKSGFFARVADFFSLKTFADDEEAEEKQGKAKNVLDGIVLDTLALFENMDADEEALEDGSYFGNRLLDDALYDDSDEDSLDDYEMDFGSDPEFDTDLEAMAGLEKATKSNATRQRVNEAGLLSAIRGIASSSRNTGIMLLADDGEGGEGGSAAYDEIYQEAFTDAQTGGEPVEIGPADNWSHCNDADGEGDVWRVYDHRTEGEVHFNKRDMDLAAKESGEYNAYADANGDGKMEGAVYGLFAKIDINHPDGKTGTIFKANDLVSIATTDRNGDGSFMAITEAPGTVYNYETGKTETTSWYSRAPKNLYREGAKSSSVQPNVVFNDGNTTEWFCDDYTEDGTYKGGLTQRLYDDNEGNNMNSWIGRPLFLGEYYIKELSRSEGYELSVNGRLNAVTNFGADLSVTEETGTGTAAVSRNMYIQGQDTIGEANEPFFEVTSEGTAANGGYDIVLTKLPAGTKIYRHDTTMKTGTYQAFDHYDYVGKVDENGNPVYKKAEVPGIPILKGDGSDDVLQEEKEATLYVNQINAVNIKTFDELKIANALKGKEQTGADGNPYYPDYNTMQGNFTMGPDSTYFIRFVKCKLEEALRTAGITTPNAKYVENGVTKTGYSEVGVPYYSRGIRKGEIDRFGVSGITPGSVATKTTYGPQIIKVEIDKKNSAGNDITNGDMIYSLLQYYMDNPYWNFGGIDDIKDAGDHYDVYLYAHNTMYTTSFAVLGENEEDTVIYRRLQFDPNDTNFEPYIVYVPYTSTPSADSFGTYSGLNLINKFGVSRVSAVLEPDVEIDRDGNLNVRKTFITKTYEIGDIIHDKDGNPVQEIVEVPVYVEKESQQYDRTWTEIPARYENGKYIIHVDLPVTDAYGAVITDADKAQTLEFKAVVPKRDIVLTQDDIKNLPSSYGAAAGAVMSSGEYEVEVKKARAFVYLDYDNQQASGEDTYIKEVILTYPGDENTFQDGDGNPGSGTLLNPVRVMERPIRQKVKIVKDIQTIPNAEEYLHDTYSEVHEDNLSKNKRGSWYDRTKDWLSSLLGKEIENQSASKIPEFRFKAYLKSNLERLYRNNDGNIVWMDRNGNALVPEYKDTDHDGNYETFVWRSGNSVTDFPEESIENNGRLESANVQKLYTKVEHVTDSTTAGDISNNVWAKYQDPQTGETRNVGELRGYTTSQDGENGEAVNVNASLYSYDDKNVNVAKSDKINKDQNVGYTRLLESTVSTIEDGAGKTRQVETYNYEKFFDGMKAANTDKWDNDMYASTKNYPGQHWFDTFEERYQMDDTDPDGTLANVDGTDKDGTAGGDRDTSFKPFQWIREKLFGTTQDAKDDYPATHNNDNLENKINTSDIAHRNAEASDAVRQFAITWYLDDEVAKLVKNNGYDEDEAKAGSMNYQEEVYDQALEQALIKAYNYLKPFYTYDLDTIYAVMWDSAENGGTDEDVTTLSADTLYSTPGKEGEQGQSKEGYYYGVSAYLPYGTYVAVEQQPFSEALGDFDNKHYKTDKPKEIILPAVYEEGGNIGAPEVFNEYYNYKTSDTPVDLARKYQIRFNEEWAKNHTDDLRNYVIRAHNYYGDYEVYKYGLDVDKLIDTITYSGGTYGYDGYVITQDVNDPLKDYYNDPLVDTAHDGGNAGSHYLADEDNKSFNTASGMPYEDDAIEKRYHFGSISENAGTADDVIYQHGNGKDDNNPSGFYFKDNVKTMTGNQTAYEGKYASMLVPWSVIEPDDSVTYDITNYKGYTDSKYRNTFYTTKIRIEKVDSETGEQLLHDDAIFSIYAASRYTSRAEIEKAGAPEGTEIGDVKFYMEDTMITGSKEFLMSMGAWNIEPVMRGRSVGMDELYSGTVAAGTPVCVEDEQIIMEDMLGNKTGQFKVYTTLNDVKTVVEEDAKGPKDKAYADQNTGYLITPQPLGAGVYVLAETKAPAGYAKTRPIAVEVYSDSVSYYMNGLMDTKVESTIYEGNLMNK